MNFQSKLHEIELLHLFVALFVEKIYLKLTFDLELWQNKSRNQKHPLVQVAFVPSGIILLQKAVGMSLTCPL